MNLKCYKTLPKWDATSLPKAFQRKHNTKVATWAKLEVFSGQLKYYALDESENVLDVIVYDKDSDIPFIEPQAWHKVESVSDDLCCQLSFYCQPEDYYQKKYGLSATHSDVFAVAQLAQSGRALDLGCASGRNALYLNHVGFDVTAFDKNPMSIDTLNKIITAECLTGINAYVANAHDTHLAGQYNLIIATVVFMFLQRAYIPKIIENMKQSTASDGYNLIVCAMDSNDYPMSAHPLPFDFGFKTGELRDYYRDWDIIKYNEDVGHLHRTGADGNPIALRFATLIAKKRHQIPC